MNFLLLIGVLVSFLSVLPHSSTAIKCFRCSSESDCEDTIKDPTEEGCTFNPSYIPACHYKVNRKLVVKERGCGGVDFTSPATLCTNRFKDVLICYCTTDWCNGFDSANSAAYAAQHFGRQEEGEKKEFKNAAANITMTAFWIALIMVLNTICN